VYVPGPAAAGLRRRLGGTATVIAPADWLALGSVLAALAGGGGSRAMGAGRGVSRLMVEGGSLIHTEFLAAGLADELQLAVAPVFVGDPAAPRFVGTAPFPHGPGARGGAGGGGRGGRVGGGAIPPPPPGLSPAAPTRGDGMAQRASRGL